MADLREEIAFRPLSRHGAVTFMLNRLALPFLDKREGKRIRKHRATDFYRLIDRDFAVERQQHHGVQPAVDHHRQQQESFSRPAWSVAEAIQFPPLRENVIAAVGETLHCIAAPFQQGFIHFSTRIFRRIPP